MKDAAKIKTLDHYEIILLVRVPQNYQRSYILCPFEAIITLDLI